MSFRPGSRVFSAFRTNFRQHYARRHASTAGAEPAGFARFWNSPVGPKTVHFWCVLLSPYPIPPHCIGNCCILRYPEPHATEPTNNPIIIPHLYTAHTNMIPGRQ
jgi:hypothetical protein